MHPPRGILSLLRNCCLHLALLVAPGICLAQTGAPRTAADSLFQRAFLEVESNRPEAALDALRAAAERGLPAFQILTMDTAFSGLRELPEFREIESRVRANAYPCLDDPAFHVLDFWLGEWEVYVGGRKQAESSITKGEGECTLHENYLTLGGYTGRSFNYYDPTDSLYHQVWVDRFNRITNYRERTSGKNFLEMESVGGRQRTRMAYRYFPDGDSVVQTLHTAPDGGGDWQPSFHGVYVRKPGTRAINLPPLAPQELVDRSIDYHDPEAAWSTFRDTFTLQEPRPNNASRATRLGLDNAAGTASIRRTGDGIEWQYSLTRDSCQITVNGDRPPTADEIAIWRLNCDNGRLFHKFYTFLQGLPMSLQAYEWTPLAFPTPDHFGGSVYRSFPLRITGAPLSEEWVLYFDEHTAALRAVAYGGGEGEYILLDGVLEKGGIRFARERRWFGGLTGDYLGSDIGF